MIQNICINDGPKAGSLLYQIVSEIPSTAACLCDDYSMAGIEHSLSAMVGIVFDICLCLLMIYSTITILRMLVRGRK